MLYRTVANGAPVNQVGLGTTCFVLVVALLLKVRLELELRWSC